ncbi:type II secretion system F family protein [Endothiovibrio diazotrophicus]
MAEKEKKQDTFLWEGTNKQGKRVKGEMPGAGDALVKAALRRQGITPLKVKKKPKALFGGGGKKITPGEIAIFARQMATMMSSGVPLIQAFDIVGRGHENPSMEKLIMDIKSEVEGGAALGDALAKHPFYFDDLFVNLVNAGEASGALETMLDKIATYKEKSESLKGKIKKALFYPIAVVVVAFIVSAILLIFVVPQFQELFNGFGAELPAFTQMVINLSVVFQEWWWAIFGGVGGVVYVFMETKKRSRKFREILDRIALRFPVFGDIVFKAAIARFARTLATMFAAGVPMVDAMTSVAGATGNIVYEKATLAMKDEVASGQQLQFVMRETQLFPNMMIQMVAIGEESGALEDMLGKVADFYEEEVDNAVDALSSLMEPMIMAFLGVVVGGLVVAMYLPIFKMGEVV